MTDQKNQTRPRKAKGRKAATIKGIPAPDVIEFPKPAAPKKDRMELIGELANSMARLALALQCIVAEELEVAKRGRR